MSTIKVDTILKRTGTGTITLGQSGDTISLPTGASLSLQGGSNGQALTTNGSGTLSFATVGGVMTPSFSAYGGTQSGVANNTSTILTCNSEVFDSDSKYDTSTYRFTPGVTGKYFFYVAFKNNQSSDRLQCGIYKNGSLISEADGRMEPENNGHGSNTYTGVQGSVISICDNTSDYFQAFGWQKSGSTLTFYNARFMGYKIIE